ncbi:MAG: hypothetical protein SGI94_20430, partial [Saprospiraceae bacterium]|nr:hypothetical protein [Saprospiraceae bacterium]
KRVDSLPWQIDFCLKGTKSTHFTSGFNASALGGGGEDSCFLAEFSEYFSDKSQKISEKRTTNLP